MKFTLAAPQAQGLRIINEIPDLALCQIEGQNGIGKSLAARLLELVTGGGQPYLSMPASWATLPALGPTSITITGLPGGEAVEFRLFDDVSSWPEEPPVDPDDVLGEAYVNGIRVQWEHARRLVRVVRIAGDESLVETIGRTMLEFSVMAGGLRRKAAPAVARWAGPLDALQRLCAIDPLSLEQARQTAAAARREAAELDRSVVSALQQQSEVADALRVGRDALARTLGMPLVLTRIDAAQQRYEAATKSLKTLQARAAASSADQTRMKDIDDEIGRQERLLTRRARLLERARATERQALTALDEQERLEDPSLSDIEQELQLRLDSLSQQVQEADLAGTVRRLAERLESQLMATPPAVQRTVVAVTVRGPLSGGDLADGLRTRREQLAGQPAPGAHAELLAEQRRTQIRLVTLQALAGLYADTDRKEVLVAEARTALRGLFTAASGGGAQELDYLDEQERSQTLVFEAGIALASAAAEAAALAGVEPVTGLVARAVPDEGRVSGADGDLDVDAEYDDGSGTVALDRAAAERLWSDADERDARLLDGSGQSGLGDAVLRRDVPAVQESLTALDAAADALAVRVRNVGHEAEDARRRDETATRALFDMRSRLREAVRALANADEWSEWRIGAAVAFDQAGLPLTVAVDRLGPAGPDDGPQADESAASAALSRMAHTAAQLNDTAARVASALAAVEGHLRQRGVRMVPREDPFEQGRAREPDQRVADALLPWIEHELSRLLASPELLDELFEGAETVRVDLDRQQVAWRARDGRPRRRPLEAFSSGEQVFAYTRAKLEQNAGLKNDHSAVVFVLDEFGAFVARDRFGKLLEFVRTRALGTTADQIVFMLPLSVDYLADESASALATGALKDAADGSVADRVRQLKERGYFAIPGGQGP